MSILASSIPVSNLLVEPSEQARCPGCGTLVPAGSDSIVSCCTTCRRSQAENEVRRLLADARDLRDGTGIFAGLTAEERREQLQQLVLSTDDGKPGEVKPIEQALSEFVNVLPESSVDLVADLVSRRIADRKREASGSIPTLVRVAVADLSNRALIDLVAETDEPVLLNAANAELTQRLCEPSKAMPLFIQEANTEPDLVTRYELEGRIEVIVEPNEPDRQYRAEAA